VRQQQQQQQHPPPQSPGARTRTQRPHNTHTRLHPRTGTRPPQNQTQATKPTAPHRETAAARVAPKDSAQPSFPSSFPSPARPFPSLLSLRLAPPHFSEHPRTPHAEETTRARTDAPTHALALPAPDAQPLPGPPRATARLLLPPRAETLNAKSEALKGWEKMRRGLSATVRLPGRVEVDKSPFLRASLCDSQRHAGWGPLVANPHAPEGNGGDESETDYNKDGDGDAPTKRATRWTPKAKRTS